MAGKPIPVRIIPQVTVKGVVCSTFPSMTACAKELHIQESHISECCSGKRNYHAGYKFMKASKDESENTFICCICGKEVHGWGNDPWPINNDKDAQCCDECDMNVVVPERLRYKEDWR